MDLTKTVTPPVVPQEKTDQDLDIEAVLAIADLSRSTLETLLKLQDDIPPHRREEFDEMVRGFESILATLWEIAETDEDEGAG